VHAVLGDRDRDLGVGDAFAGELLADDGQQAAEVVDVADEVAAEEVRREEPFEALEGEERKARMLGLRRKRSR